TTPRVALSGALRVSKKISKSNPKAIKGENSMKIVRFYTCGEPDVLRLEETETPQPKAGQVLIQVEAIGVNYTDVDHRRSVSASREPLTFPSTPGVEVVGTVIEAGEGAATLPVGTRDRADSARRLCGICGGASRLDHSG